MKLKHVLLSFWLLSLSPLFFISNTNADLYQNIGPLDTLENVKTKMPKANYEKIDAAWATEEDVLYSITGEGLTGIIVVKFIDKRPEYKRELDKISDDTDADHQPTEENINYIEFLSSIAFESDEKALTVSWVRWIPSNHIPLKRFVLKYGKPDHSGFSDQAMIPYKEWTERGFIAYLSDDGLFVERVDYSFNTDDYRKAYKEKFGFIPAWLQKPENKSIKKPSKKTKSKRK